MYVCVYVFSFITLSTYKCYEGCIFFHSVMIKTQNPLINIDNI